MNKSRFLTKDDSKFIYGIAILLMIYHHLAAFPERFNFNFQYLFSSDIEIYLGIFAKICVALYAFISGYGLYASMTNHSSKYSVIQHLIKFYQKYWLVFILFIPLGILAGKFQFSTVNILGSIGGVYQKYNGEWWYVGEYLNILITFPVFYKLINYLDRTYILNSKKNTWIKIFIYLLLIIIVRRIDLYLAVCLVGMTCNKFSLFERLEIFLSRYKLSVLGAIFFLSMILAFRTQTNNSDIFCAPLLIWSIIILKNNLNHSVINRFILYLGRYSIYMWLVHTFFAYYYFQNIILLGKYSVFIFILILLISLLSAILIDKLYCIISNKISIVAGLKTYHKTIYILLSIYVWSHLSWKLVAHYIL